MKYPQPDNSRATAETASVHARIRDVEDERDRFFALSVDLLCIVGPDGSFRRVNPACTRVLGYAEDELLQRCVLDLIHPDDREATRRLMRQLGSGQAVVHFQNRVRGTDGAYRWLDWTAAPSPAGLIYAVARDVTDRKTLEAQRETLARVEKLRALGQMASGIAHDLNQRLALIAGYGDLARQELQRLPWRSSQLEEALGVMAQAAIDGGESVTRLLTFVRGHQEGEPGVVEIQALLNEVARLTAPRWRDAAQTGNRAIRLEVQAAAGLMVYGWPVSLREALTNLIFNAVDALPHGGTISLTATARGERVEITVSDTGVGMPPEVQARIFEPFFSTKGERGTGLGLPMVFGIVERHQGTIRVTSAPDAGATFVLDLPAADTARRGGCERQPENGPVGTRGLRVLAVDDEPALARMIALLLSQHGHQVVTASSAEEALRLLTERAVELVITDLSLGEGMDGWGLAEAVRTQRPAVPVVLATGWGATIDPREAQQRGVAAVIAKPYRAADLERVMAEVTSPSAE